VSPLYFACLESAPVQVVSSPTSFTLTLTPWRGTLVLSFQVPVDLFNLDGPDKQLLSLALFFFPKCRVWLAFALSAGFFFLHEVCPQSSTSRRAGPGQPYAKRRTTTPSLEGPASLCQAGHDLGLSSFRISIHSKSCGSALSTY